MKIVTITLNPAFDIHCHIDNFVPFQENLATVTERDPGGKGINISRALSATGIPNTALVVLGQENAVDFCHCLSAEGVLTKALLVPGRIRENITIHANNSNETRISFQGFSADDSLLEKVEREILSILEKGDFVTFTGRIPGGIHMERIKNFLSALKENGAKIILDSRSFEINDVLDVKPWLIKPNQEEISHYLNREISSFEDAVFGAKELKSAGITNVMISMGRLGAILSCDEGTFIATAPKIQVLSTIGAGDSAIAGFLEASVSKKPAEICLQTAVAYGSAACLQKGTKPPTKNDIQVLIKEIGIKAYHS